MGSPVAAIEGLTVRYGRTVAVRDLSFTVAEGSVCAFLGQNGAGKTTTIKTLLGLQKPAAGRSSVFGLDSRRDGIAIRARTGYVPDEFGIYRWMTAREAGWFVGGFYPTWSEPCYRGLLERFQIDPGKRVSAYSKGMRMKLALALALAHEPRFLVLDEPTGGLDVQVRREFLESLVDFAAAGGTVLISTHQVADIERVASDVVMIDGSRLVASGSLEGLKRSTREVALSFEEPPAAVLHPDLLKATLHGRTWRLRVRNFAEPLLHDLRARYRPDAVETAGLPLEEIFLAHVREREGGHA